MFPKPVWVFLVIVDFCLLLLGFMTMSLQVSILALLLAYLIHRCGLVELFGPDRGKSITLHDRKVQITPEQRREIVETLRAERLERRQERRQRRQRAKDRVSS